MVGEEGFKGDEFHLRCCLRLGKKFREVLYQFGEEEAIMPSIPPHDGGLPARS